MFPGGEALAGTRQGRIVLVALRDSVDPETDGRLTVKRYHSEKVFASDAGFIHARLTLKPLNLDSAPIVIEQAPEDELFVRGEFTGLIDFPSITGSGNNPSASSGANPPVR
jgi:hypothetical protein